MVWIILKGKSKNDKNENDFLTIESKINSLKEKFNNTDDFKVRTLNSKAVNAKLVYLETVVDKDLIEENLIIPISTTSEFNQTINALADTKLNNLNDAELIIEKILSGFCLLLIEEKGKYYLFDVSLAVNRSPDEPDNEKIVRGAHRGFIEDMNVNINLLRQRIINRDLVIKYFLVGPEKNIKAAIIYIENVAESSIVNELIERVKKVSTDFAQLPGMVEECIEDYPLSPFPQSIFTERPDHLEAYLKEGKVALMIDEGTNAVVVPVTFASFFRSLDDYTDRFYFASIIRLLRIFSFWGVLILPSLYIAIVTFHFEIIPYELVTLVKTSIDTVPYPPFIEAVIMAVTIELIRESGIRLPSPIGETIGIVGGLIIGDAVINAGLISNVMVIVIALTAIMSFTIPAYEMGNTVRILTLPIMAGAALFGFIGIVFSFSFIIVHLCKLNSFGVPYLAPINNLSLQNLKKTTLLRLPAWLLDDKNN